MSTFLSPHLTHPFFNPYPLLATRTIPRVRARGPVVVARFGGLNSGQFPDAENIKELIGKAEGILYTLADAAVGNSDVVDTSSSKQNGDWFSGITSSMESILKVLKEGLSTVHVPYSYGFAIILLTVLVKAATFPLSKKQVESTMAMKSLQPQIKAIQKRYAGDQERIQLETARLYKLAGINPLAGCLPTLATIPVWIGLYRALSNVANEGLLTEGFFWIPSLAGPTTVAARSSGSGISWLFPFVDGHPPLGWSDTAAYLVLPVLLIISQYISIQIMQSSQPDDPNLKTSRAITNFLPLMIGYFSLSVPSGLSIYWLTNNILSTCQQVWLQKMGGAKNPVGQLGSDVFKEDQSQPLNTLNEANSIQAVVDTPSVKSIQAEVDTPSTKSIQAEVDKPSTGPRPGDRFRQLKEEEARRKRQKEEAANGSVSGLIEGKNTDQSKTSVSSNGIEANGDVNGFVSKDHLDTSDTSNANGRPISDVSDVQENLGKEAVGSYNKAGLKDESSEQEAS